MIKKCLLLTGWMLSCLFSLNAFAQGKIVISQVYGGGGNTAAPYTHDFIELFNRGKEPVSLNGLSLQYASATGTGNFGANSGQLTELPNVTLQPGQYFLVQQAGGTTGAALPDADLIDATPINMSGTAGKVALVTGLSPLGCNGGSAPCNDEAKARILDLVGYGSANYYEGAGATPAPSNITAALRNDSGCTDTDSNNVDFTTGAPTPRNIFTAIYHCVTATPNNLSATASSTPATVAPGDQTLFAVTVTPGTNPASTGISVTGDLTSIGGSASQPLFDNGTNGDAIAGDNVFSFLATVSEGTTAGSKAIVFTIADIENRTASVNLSIQIINAVTAIYTIQGSSAVSPLVGQTVTTQGVVIGDFQASNQLNGFFIQDVTGDNISATSDGIFVYIPPANSLSSVDISLGQIVRVTGKVTEFNGQTQIDNISSIEVQGSSSVAPVTVSLPASTTDLLEQYEGMLVTFPQVLTVSQNFTLGRFGEVWLSAGPDYSFNKLDGRLYNPTNFIDPTDNPATGVANTSDNKAAVKAQQDLHNLSSILLDDASSVQNPAYVPYLGPDNTLRVGSTVNNLTGVLTYAFNAYRIQPTQAPAFTYAPRPLIPPSTGNANLKIASFNVLNYFVTFGGSSDRGASNLTEFNRQRDKIIAALQSLDADVVGLIEMQNNGDGNNSAIADLVNGLNKIIGAGTYDYIRDATNGGTGTDAIKVAFIYKPGAVSPVGTPMADLDPVHNRPPLAHTFRLNSNGELVTVVINHFKSKGGSGSGADADQKDGQGAFNATRVKQAEALANFINNTVIPAAKDKDIIILGDLNAYAEEDPIDVLRAAGFISLFGTESYSYVFDGQSGSLDHALVSPSLAKQFTTGGKWHINADEPVFLDYNLEFKGAGRTPDLYEASPFRSSDHDPVLVGLKLYTPVINFAVSTITRNEGSGAYEVVVTAENNDAPYTNLLIPITINAARNVRYGERRDYITNPAGETGNFTLNFPAGETQASFTVTPLLDDDNERFAENVTFTLSPAAGTDYKVGKQNNFVFTIQEVKKNTSQEGTFPTVSPNPTTGAVTIATQTENEIIETTLYSPEGELLYNGKGNANEMSQKISNTLQGRRGGIYHLQTITADEIVNTRIMKF